MAKKNGGAIRGAGGGARDLPIGRGRQLLFAAVLYVGFFAALEGALYLAGVPTLIEREDPFRGFSGLVHVFEREGAVYRTRRAHTRSTFNDQSFLAEKPDDGLRIFTLGGSSSFGFPWGAEAAFTGILGEALAASHPERTVEAINASGTSYAMHRLNIVADELLGYEPDVFIIYSGHNEFIEPAFFDALKRRSGARNQLEYLLSHSRAYAGLRALSERLRQGEPAPDPDFDADVRRDETRIRSPEEKQAIVDEYRWRLARIVRRAHAAGVRVVLVTVPANLSEWRPQASTTDPSLTGEARQRWTEALGAGRHLLDSGDLAAAAARLEAAVQLAPEHAETGFLLGRAYEGLGRFDAARAAYERACDADASPIRRISGINRAIREVAREQGALLVDADRIFREQSEHGLVGFGLIEDYVHPTRRGHEIIAWHVYRAMEGSGWLGDEAAASRALFDRVLAARRDRPLKPNAAWFYNQGVVLADQGRRDAAIEKLREALALEPDYPAALQNLGVLLSEAGRDAEAVVLLERLLASEPDRAATHFNLGNALLNLGRTEEAVARYREALRLAPGVADVHTNLGNALQRLGRLDEAVAQYREAARIRPDDAVVYDNWGLALAAAGRTEQAAARFEQALRLAPDYAEAHQNLGSLHARQGDLEAAEVHFRAHVRLRPDDADARYRLGVALYQQGRTDEAVDELDRVLRARPGDVALHRALAAIARSRGDVPEQVRHLREVVRSEPGDLAATNDLAWILATSDDARIRDGAAALALAQRLAEATGHAQAVALDTLAAAWAEIGDFDEAVRWQTRAVELADPPQRDDFRERLTLYEREERFHQPTPGRAEAPGGGSEGHVRERPLESRRTRPRAASAAGTGGA